MSPPRGASGIVQTAEPIAFAELFNLFSKPGLSREARRDLLEALLKTPGGPFMKPERRMEDSVRDLARYVTWQELVKRDKPANCVNPEEVFQEAMLVLIQRCESVREPASLRSWLWTVMTRVVAKNLAKNRMFREKDDVAFAGLAERPSPETTDETLGEASTEAPVHPRVAAVRMAIAGLPPKLRKIVELHGLGEKSHEEAARELGIKPTTARVRWHRARKLLLSKLVVKPQMTG
jgi:RNA polymerase sigma factor (sigma-70 family)